jgi:hypothetical protein
LARFRGPLEFQTSNIFLEQGFDAKQGHYTIDDRGGQAREIDVVGDIDMRLGGNEFFRASQVIECKWSRDKPWVVFTSERSIMAERACIAQTIGSPLGRAAMYCAASSPNLYSMETFKHPLRGGFAGRRAFEKQSDDRQDQFYKAMQGIANAAIIEARTHNDASLAKAGVPDFGLIVFPVIVLDGTLFSLRSSLQLEYE